MGGVWAGRTQPRSFADIPQPERTKLEQFVRTFGKQKKKAMLLYGPSGTCKTSAVHALAHELNWEIVEVNASDTRNEAQLQERVGNAIKQRSLFFAGKLILVDEVDGVSGTGDRGGIPELVNLIGQTSFPIILTAQDPWDKKFSSLRSKCVLVEFPGLSADSIATVLSNVCTQQGISTDSSALKALARRAGGDLRAAINDLHIVSQGTKSIAVDALSILDERNRLEQMEQALIKVFKNSDPAIALGAFDQTDTDVNECFLWLEHNLAKEYTNPEDRARAYDILSRADVFRGRIRRQQHWRFLSYIFELITGGIAVAKDERSKSPPKYEQTSRLLKIWQANMRYAKRKSIAHKLAESTHSSSKIALHHTLPWLQVVCKKKPDTAKQLAEELDLDDDELTWLVTH